MAEALAVAPPLPRQPMAAYAPDDARAAANALLDRVPLPPGGNLNGVGWEALGGIYSARDIQAVTQFNAFCQWLRAWRDGRDPATARSVLDQVPRWPMFRAVTDYDYGVVIAELHAGAGPHLRQKLSECDDSHRAEITNAIGMGLVPPV